jgi:ParB family transcriptional regulator, chromosome partitioning protein
MVDRRLGRGLDFFLSGGRQNAAPPAQVPTQAANAVGAKQEAAKPDADGVMQVAVEQLVPSQFQPRKHIDPTELKTLAESVKASGILQPILVRPAGEKLEIVAGERRWRAAQLAGLSQVPVLVRGISDQDSAVFGLVENLQREDLNAIEKAQGFRLLMKKLAVTQDEVAKRVGFERSTVANFMRLLDLPDAVQAHVSRGTLSMGHARALLALPDAATQTQCADECIKQGWSVRALEANVKGALEAPIQAAGAEATKDGKSRPVWLNELEETLVESLGTTVSIRYGRKRSQIIVECAGREEFERIYQRLKNA